jgi:D-sedoheptulose 7-phosphate isomerase
MALPVARRPALTLEPPPPAVIVCGEVTMTAEKLLQANIQASAATLQSLTALAAPLAQAARLATDCLLAGNKLLLCGNGGSACDAAHLATEFVGRFNADRRPLPAICLTDSGSTLTSIANDFGYDQVFARQVHGFARPGDVLIAITTSGKSKNIVLALEAARDIGIASIAFLGKGGGLAKGIATVDLLVPSQVTARVQEAHLLLYHTLCEMVDAVLLA